MSLSGLAGQEPKRHRAADLPDSALAALGGQTLAGILLGLIWLVAAPRPVAQWIGTYWLARSELDFSAGQDVLFGLLMVGAGLVTGTLLAIWSAGPRPARRAALWFGGSVLGAAACALVGCALGGAFAVHQVGANLVAPLTLTSWGLLAAWPAVAGLVVAATLIARGLFGRTW
ncbi:MAG: hypothetical protein LBJ62_07965 [Bifidobacteriaceae bacterium]|jgi:hypothetical protein|nr:hypothetical protein [Bifidobacteriaceae bacterium]